MSETVPEWDQVRAASEIRRAYLDDVFFQIRWAVNNLPGKMRDIEIAAVNERVTELAKYLSEKDKEESWFSFLLGAALAGVAGLAAPLLIEFMAAASIYALAAAASASTGVQLSPPVRYKNATDAVKAWKERFPGTVTYSGGAANQATKSTLQRLLSKPRPSISETEATSLIPTRTFSHIAGRIATEFRVEERLHDATKERMKELEGDAANREELWSLIRSCDDWIDRFAEQVKPTTSANGDGFFSMKSQLAKGAQAASSRTASRLSIPANVRIAPLRAKYVAEGAASPTILSDLGEQLLRGWSFALTALITNPIGMVDVTPRFYDRYQRQYHITYIQHGRTEVDFGLEKPSRYLGIHSTPYDAREFGFGYRLDGRQVCDRVEPGDSRARVLAGIASNPVFWAPPDFRRTFFEAVPAQRIKLEHAANAYFRGAPLGESSRIQLSFGDEDHDRWLRRYREEAALTELVAALERYRNQVFESALLDWIDKATRRPGGGQ